MNAAFYLARPTHPTGDGIWRKSFRVDDPRAKVHRPIGDGTPEGAGIFIQNLVDTLDEYADEIKQPGRSHQITANVIKLVCRMLLKLTTWKTGECEPSIEALMKVTRFSRRTVIRLREIARSNGLLDWVRRTEETGNTPGEGPRLKQTTNAYFFEISRMPIEVQRRLRQRLAKRGREDLAKEYPNRWGSGAVPGKFARQARRLIHGLSNAFSGHRRAGPAEMKALDDILSELPTSEWAPLLFPDNPEEQRRWNEEHGFAPAPSASLPTALVPPP